jgi:hypothetical protein
LATNTTVLTKQTVRCLNAVFIVSLYAWVARWQFYRLMSTYPTSTSSSIATRLQFGAEMIVTTRTIRPVRRREYYRSVHAKTHRRINEQQASRRYQYALILK